MDPAASSHASANAAPERSKSVRNRFLTAICERDNEPLADGFGIADKGVDGGIGALATFQFGDGRAIHARALGEVSETQSLGFAGGPQLWQQRFDHFKRRRAFVMPGDEFGEFGGNLLTNLTDRGRFSGVRPRSRVMRRSAIG